MNGKSAYQNHYLKKNMKKTTLKKIFSMLKEINSHSVYLYLEAGSNFVSFPHHRFSDYDDNKDLLQQDIDYTKEKILLLLKKGNLTNVEIVDLKSDFRWSQTVNLSLKELDDYLLKTINNIVVNKTLKEI